MPAASRGKQKRHSLVTPSETSESSEESRTTSPIEIDVYTPPTPPTNEESPKEGGKGKTVAMSVGGPRLTVNGKRVGRPPGTFKTHRHPPASTKRLPSPKICRWEDCNTEFYTVSDIVKHMFGTHTKTKSTVCKWTGCDNRSFKSYYMLVGHIRTHTGERPMKCEHEGCSKAYKTRENLNTHMRTHTGEKPYQCQFVNCGKCFTNASDRGKHENRCHSDKKEYICDVDNCDKSYTDPSSLRKHVICVHGPEAQENRKKVKVRWVFRRDGLKVDNNDNSTVEQIKEEIEEPVQEEEPVAEVKPVDPMLSLFEAIETEDARMMEILRRQSASATYQPLPQPVMLPPLQPELLLPKPQLQQDPAGSAFRPVSRTPNVLMANSTAPIDLNAMANAQAQAMIMQYLQNQAAKQLPGAPAVVPVLPHPVQQLLSQLLTPVQSVPIPGLVPQMGLFMTPGAFSSTNTLKF